MPTIPKKRLLVYAGAGFLVLAIGAIGLLTMHSPGGAQTQGIVLDVSGAQAGAGPGSTWPAGSTISTPVVSTTASSTTSTEAPLIYVQVAGAVRRPGVYQVASDARAFQAVMQAGGFTEDADQQAVPSGRPFERRVQAIHPAPRRDRDGAGALVGSGSRQRVDRTDERAGLAQLGHPGGARYPARDRPFPRPTDRLLPREEGSFHLHRPTGGGTGHRPFQAGAVAAAGRSLTPGCRMPIAVAALPPGSSAAPVWRDASPSRRRWGFRSPRYFPGAIWSPSSV